MPTSRRDFLRTSAIVGGAIGAGLAGLPSLASGAPPGGDSSGSGGPARHPGRAAKPLRLLILGGTGFIGPHEVRYALDRGHTVTLFNRGKTDPGLFPELETLIGDRATGDYSALAGRDWDVVIDDPTTIPRWARQAAAALRGHVRQYIFVSTISVYAANDTPGADETAALATTSTPESEDVRAHPALYGPLKALSEGEIQRAFPGQSTIVRPGLIVGPGDPSDRFTYWPARLRRGGEVLAPGDPTDPVQFIDARDLAAFLIRCAEDGTTGVYNATGPRSRLTMAEMLGGIRAVMSGDARLTWVPADFLGAHKVRPWSDMPVWVPPMGEARGFAERSIQRALDKGLGFRPLAETARDTLAYYEGEPEARRTAMRAGLDAGRERQVLADWHASRKTS